MKQFKRSLSLILAAVLLLSMVYIAPAASNAAASDYISTSYAASLSVKTTKAVALMTAPTTASTAKYSIPVNTMLTVKALHKNTSNTYWYEVLFYNQTLYIDATATTMVDHLTGDVTIDNVQTPASLAYGRSFNIKGDISATLNDLGTITAAMYTSSNITKAPYMSVSANAGGKSFSLYGSTIDKGMAFGSANPGVYTFVVTAEAISYYIDSSGSLTTSTRTVVLENKQCVITDWTRPNDDLAFGIDVSTWNGSIDWSKTKNVIDFAILRIGFSTTLDNRFLEYASNCETYGIPYGVYHYSYALTEAQAIAEAEFVIQTLRTYDYNPQLPIWFDMEDGTQASLSTSLKEALVVAFCDTIAEAGYQPGFYGFTSWFSSSFSAGYLSSLPQWIAQVDGFSSNGTATYDGGTWLWQYSWKGSISGISGDVDCNLCYAEIPGVTSDTSYLASCTYYPAHSVGTINGTVNVRQYPSTSYSTLGTVASGTEVEVTGIYKNTANEYWYQVITSLGTGYVRSDLLTVNEFLYDDLAVIDPVMATNMNVGSSYYLDGTLVSHINNIYTTYAKIYSGENTLATPVLSSSYTNNSKKYDLNGSTVCSNMVFSSLSAGYYTYEISADVKNYYVFNGILTSQTENVAVWTAPFTVGNAAITPPSDVSCAHTLVTDAAVAATCTSSGLTAGTHCTKCGVTVTPQTVIPATGHNYSVTTEAATCQNYELFHYSCSKCGNQFDVYADELMEWTDIKPLDVAESRIESKTQYRYADFVSGAWGAWSAWSDTVYTAVENVRKVETRTVYRLSNAQLGAHNYVNGRCTVCGIAPGEVIQDYYLVGYINSADHGCEWDWENLGDYKFVGGKLTATFETDSYVFIKTGDNLSWYMTQDYVTDSIATFYNTSTGTAEKMYVPSGVEVTFTLVENGDGSLSLSYTQAETPVVENSKDIKWQITKGTTASSASTNLRFLTWVDSPANYSSVTFNVTINGKTSKLKSTTAYTAILASGTAIRNPANIFKDDTANYFVTYTLKNVPSSYFDIPIVVTVTWTDLEGNEKTSESKTIVIFSDWA